MKNSRGGKSKLRHYIFTLAMVFLLVNDHRAQTYQTQQLGVFAYNLVSNGLIGGIGGAINRAKNENFFKSFANNFGKGLLGGLVKYGAKSHLYYFRYPENALLAPLNRLAYFTGHSFVMNASLNKKLLDTYYCNFYGLDLRLRMSDTTGRRFRARLSLATLGTVAVFVYNGNRINLPKTLSYGLFYLDLNPAASYNGNLLAGQAYYNMIAIRQDLPGQTFSIIIPHEIVHTYQFYDFLPLSNLYHPKIEHLYKDRKFYRIFSDYVYLDYEIVFCQLIYRLQPRPRYYRNFLEFEAEHFGSRKYIVR